MQKLIISLRVLLTFAILLGLGYPLIMVRLSQIIFPYQANGSLLKANGKIIGSALIAQEFTAHKYFHSRFSVVNYDARKSGGSNLAPSNPILYRQTEKYINHVRTENGLNLGIKLPADMVLSSASGLDPHISLENALLQLPRVATHRHLSHRTIERLINGCIDPDFIGVWGEEGVNVLRLNLLLDKLEEKA